MIIKQKTNILIIMPNLMTGGAERIVTSYANWIVNNTIGNVTILLYAKPNCIYEIDERVNIVYPQKLRNNKIAKFISRRNFIKKIIKEKNINVVFTLFPRCAFLVNSIKKKNYVTIFSERCNPKFVSKFNNFLSNYVSLKSDGVIFQTERIKEMFPKKVQNNSCVIYNPVSNPNVFKINKNIKKENNITALGRLCYQKGFDTLIKAFKMISEEFSNYKLFIYGEGCEHQKLIDLIRKYNLEDKVILAGTNPNAILEIAKSKIFVLSSRYEGMPNALLEAMAVGTACISTDCVAGPRELINNYENGILTPVDDVKEMYKKIRELILNNDLRNKIEINSKNILKTNSSDSIFLQYYKYMSNIYNNKYKE